MKLRHIAPLVLIALFLTACNLPKTSSNTPDTVDSLPFTPTPITPGAPIAATTQAVPQNTATPFPTNTLPSPSPTASATITPTYSVPMVSVSESTNCRSGPGTNYTLLVTVNPGVSLEIIGAYPPAYWLVKTDFGECFLYNEFATPVGSFWVVGSVTPPPTATASPPNAPIFQKWDYYCNAVTGQTDITLTWSDTSNGEDGYRVIRDGDVAATLAANTTQYFESIPLVSGESVQYSIEAFMGELKASSSTITITCP